MQRFSKTILTLSSWYSFESSCWVPSDEYPFIYQGFGHFSGFLHHFVLAKLATSSIRVIGMLHLLIVRISKLLENKEQKQFMNMFTSRKSWRSNLSVFWVYGFYKQLFWASGYSLLGLTEMPFMMGKFLPRMCLKLCAWKWIANTTVRGNFPVQNLPRSTGKPGFGTIYFWY